MPQYHSAAEVRAAHPGVYDDLSDAQIERGLAKAGSSAPVEYDANYRPDPEGKHLSLTEDPSRYIGHLAKGALHSPLDLVKNFVGAVSHPYDALTGTASTIAHALKNRSETLEWLNTHPDEVGSFAGQAVLGEAAPGAIDTALAKGPSVVGRGMSAVGRGVEAVGDVASKTNKRGIVPIATAMTGHPWLTAAELAAPPVLKGTGRMMQRGGAALEGLDLSVSGLDRRFPGAPPVEVNPLDPEAATVRETVNTARDAEAGGASRKQAAARAGWPLGKSEEVPYQYPAEAVNPDLFPHQKEALAEGRQLPLERRYLEENPWALDASAKPVDPQDLSPALVGLKSAVRRSGLSPIEKFYEDDPQARVGGEGRMTGQFEEGDGGLADAAAGKIAPYDMPSNPSPLDALARLSGRSMSPARMQELLDKFGGAGR